MQRVLIALSAILLVGVSPVHAEIQQSLVLIDTGVNTSLFPNVIYEVCTVESGLCPNGKSFMEGIGASNLPKTTNATFNHGTQLLSIITKVNPNLKVIPIRIVGMTDTGAPYLYSLASVKSALDWVVSNRERFNISVVSLSQGRVYANCYMPDGMAKGLAQLKANNVQVVVSTGNNSNRTAMFSPACSPDAISVGATDNPAIKAGVAWNKTATPYIARYSNGNAQTTLYANARWFVTNLDGSTKFTVGTSNATASIASWLTLHKGTTWSTTYTNLTTSATGTATNEWLTGRYLFIDN